MRLSARLADAAVASVGVVVAVGVRGLTVMAVAASAPLGLLRRVDRALANIADISRSAEAMHGEFVGMRADILGLDERVSGLREGIEGVRSELRELRSEIVDPIAEVPPMRAGVDRLEGQIEVLSERLEAVETLAIRLGRFARVRRRAKEAGPQVVEEEEVVEEVVEEQIAPVDLNGEPRRGALDEKGATRD